MNYARKWHEAGSKRVKACSEMARTGLENGTNQARKWQEPGSKMVRTRLENGTSWTRKRHELGSKPARKVLQFVSFRLEARRAKWLEARHNRIIDVTQITGTCNSVRKALCIPTFGVSIRRYCTSNGNLSTYQLLYSH